MIKYLLFTISCIISANISNGQNNLGFVAGKYCRSNPYVGDFNTFLQHLLNDPTLKQQEFVKKTDSTLYSFTGLYSTHQPFAFKSNKVQVALWEESIALSDTLSLQDTIINYLISAYLPNTPANQKLVKKELNHIHNRNKRYFSSTSHVDLTNKKKEINGGGYNMFVLMHAMAPFSVMWQTDTEKNEIGLHLLFRISNNTNKSETPLPLFEGF